MAKAASQNPSTTPGRPTARAFGHTLSFLIALYTLALVWGVRNIYFWVPSRIDLVFPFAFAIVLGSWAIVDARRRRHPIPLLARQWFLLGAGVFVPGYVIWTRRWYGVGWLALHTILWFTITVGVMHIGGLLVFGEQWLHVLGLPRTT